MRQSNVNPLFTLDPSRKYPILARGKGVYLYDDQGRQYLDAISGIAVMSVGYGRQEIVNAMAAQASDLPYAASNVFSNKSAIQLTQRMIEKIPHLCSSVHLTSGGSEAVEGLAPYFHFCCEPGFIYGSSDCSGYFGKRIFGGKCPHSRAVYAQETANTESISNCRRYKRHRSYGRDRDGPG